MARARVHTNWSKSQLKVDLNPILKKYEDYLRYNGYRESSVLRYSHLVKIYIKKANSITPNSECAFKFREGLLKSNFRSSTINLYGAALKQFYRMQGEDISFPFLPVDNKLPYYLSSDDIIKILSVIKNLKHYCMICLSFYCLLRASDLVNLDDNDVDLKNLNLRIRGGKGGKDAIIPINPDCADLLRQYLEIRPKVVLEDGSIPFFPTDYYNRWERRDLYRMFVGYKRKAGISIPGGTHLLRHAGATILLKNGADLLTVKTLLRHASISTTERYLHLTQESIRQKYEKYLVL
jgi:site-specific recombinase XerD